MNDIRLLLALLASLILPAAAAAGEERAADAVSVFHCRFNEEWDMNFDHWPDRWVRQTGVEFPHYVRIGIQDDETAVGKKCLRLELDGAAAAVSSPPIRVMSRFSYDFEARLKNEGLKHSVVVITLEFSDTNGRVLQTCRSKPFSTTKGWEQVRFEHVELTDKAIDRVVARLEVVRSNKGDLHGRVSLADISLARLPRITVSSDSPYNVYDDLKKVVVRCELSGIRESNPEIYFQLFDKNDKELESHHERLNGRQIVDEAQQTAALTDGVDKGLVGYEGTAEWRPNIPDYGFYRVVVKMVSPQASDGDGDSERNLDSREVWLAVVPPLPMPRGGEFGWTLPDADKPLSFQDLSRLLPQVGINWVKVPVWFDADNPRRGDELIRFVELLGASNIEAIGIIDRPPANYELSPRTGVNLPVADLLSEDTSATWSASLEPVMTRLSLRVRWWQLGREYDTSFAGIVGLPQRINDLRTLLFRFGQDVKLGMSWEWDNENRASGPVPWDFEQLCINPRPNEAKLNELLEMSRKSSAEHWVLIEPPPRPTSESQFDAQALADRASEFVRQLVAAKIRGVRAIIVPNPFNDENGLMRASGMASELLLPWRTTAAMLGGASYLGQMQLPGGSENRIFLRPDGRVVMVVWNSEPTREVLYLGQDVEHIDIDGRSTMPANEGNEQVIDVGPVPSFVLGLHEAITRWRMAVSFEHTQVPSIFMKPHRNSLRVQNFFSQGVGGSLRIIVPQQAHAEKNLNADGFMAESSGLVTDRWSIEPPHGTIVLAAGEKYEFPFDIRLKNALFGRQPIRVEFKLQADEQYEFSVYTELEVGTVDLTLDVKTHVDKAGTLIVEQLMTNSAKQLADFRCYLWAKGHRRQRVQVYRLGANLDRKVYRYPNGAGLVGTSMLLEIEEQNGPRVLKYQFVATAEAPRDEASDTNKDDASNEETAPPDTVEPALTTVTVE
ncbi:MAG TPA: hypothetical protein VJ828_04115 [Lacipirellulaceae bacterium]|nr:hypothetical protein [Lacipirellulaceae bacterium]